MVALVRRQAGCRAARWRLGTACVWLWTACRHCNIAARSHLLCPCTAGGATRTCRCETCLSAASTPLVLMCFCAVLAYTVAALSPNMDVANAALPAYVVVSFVWGCGSSYWLHRGIDCCSVQLVARAARACSPIMLCKSACLRGAVPPNTGVAEEMEPHPLLLTQPAANPYLCFPVAAAPGRRCSSSPASSSALTRSPTTGSGERAWKPAAVPGKWLSLLHFAECFPLPSPVGYPAWMGCMSASLPVAFLASLITRLHSCFKLAPVPTSC